MELTEYNFEIEYLQGKMNVVADHMSRQKNKFNIKEKTMELLETDIFAHSVSSDFEMSKGFAKTINDRFQSRGYCLQSKLDNKNLIFQKTNNKTIFKLVTKDKYSNSLY